MRKRSVGQMASMKVHHRPRRLAKFTPSSPPLSITCAKWSKKPHCLSIGRLPPLVLRSESASNVTGSSSTPDYIGRAVVWNGHFADDAALIEQLIHEAIHCHAYRLESTVPLGTIRTQSRRRIESPWTG